MIDISFIQRCNDLFEDEGNRNVKEEKERHSEILPRYTRRIAC